jgi:hypothetical protein
VFEIDFGMPFQQVVLVSCPGFVKKKQLYLTKISRGHMGLQAVKSGDRVTFYSTTDFLVSPLRSKACRMKSSLMVTLLHSRLMAGVVLKALICSNAARREAW